MNRLATPGVVLIIAGVLIAYWGMGIFRGETSGSPGFTKRWNSTPIPKVDDDADIPTSGTGGGGRLM